MRVFFGILLVLLPFAALGLNSCAAGISGHTTPSSESLLTLSVFGIAFSLGVYLLIGPSRLTKRAHLTFGFIGVCLLVVTGLTAWSSPADFDIDIVIYYMLIFGAVYFGILAIGYIRAPDKPDVDRFSEPEGRKHDDRLH